MKMKNTKTSLALALACLGSVAATNVSQAALTQINIQAAGGVNMSSTAYNNNSAIASSGSWAGSWNATIVSGQTYAPQYGIGSTFYAFCTDIGNQNGNGTYNYQASAFSDASIMTGDNDGAPPDPRWASASSGGRAAWVYNTFISPGVNSVALGNGASTTINGNSYSLAQRRSAMCIAIWEALYEGSGTFDVTAYSTSGRSFKATGDASVTTLANYWLGLGANVNFAGYDFTWWAEQQTPDVQSLVGPNAAVPEPSTVIAGLLLLLPFAASTLRMIRKNRVA